MKYYKVSEWIYLIITIISIVETISLWNIDREKSYFFIVFAILSFSMYLFRRFYRKKFNKRSEK
jgi:uncharacterized membrane protein YiaA